MKFQPLPTALDSELEWLVEPEDVLGVHYKEATREVLILWKGLLDFESS